MAQVLSLPQREQAGSDSYNRFEYQVHWIACHIIGKLQNDTECIVFCEFHDDMAEFFPESQQYQFYQIKTKDESSEWTVAELSKREKKKSGGYKKSFLGFIFYNFLNFGTECSHCHFISNNDFDEDIRLWQSYIEDGKTVQCENTELFLKIKDRIKAEYLDDMPTKFDEVYEEFIQNTFVHKSELQLSTYDTQTMGKFFNQLADKDIPSNTANLIFQQLLNDVRRKSKEKIKTPISLKGLIDKKGVVVGQISKKINGNIGKNGNYNGFHEYLLMQSLPANQVQLIESAKTLHDSRWLDVNDIKYQETIIVLRKTISTYSGLIVEDTDIVTVKNKCMQELQKNSLLSDSLDEILIEVLYYEQKFNEIN